MNDRPAGLVCHPLTPDRSNDLVALFGDERGAYGGCWCLYWRFDGTQKAFWGQDRSARKAAFETVVHESTPPPGLLAYDAVSRPVGWVAVGPRDLYPRFNAQKASQLPDGSETAGLWSITCFYIDKSARRSGLMRRLIRAAVAFAGEHGAQAIDAAPLDVSRKLVAGEGYVGIASAFRAEGFEVVARQSTAKPLMRRRLV